MPNKNKIIQFHKTRNKEIMEGFKKAKKIRVSIKRKGAVSRAFEQTKSDLIPILVCLFVIAIIVILEKF